MKAIVRLLLPALLMFSFGSTLEVMHPIEEDTTAARHHHPETGDGSVVHDSSQDLAAHDHHYCAHCNAIAYVSTLVTAFQGLSMPVPVASEHLSAAVRPFFTVFDRGPPRL